MIVTMLMQKQDHAMMRLASRKDLALHRDNRLFGDMVSGPSGNVNYRKTIIQRMSRSDFIGGRMV
jgi:hypothetical protein